MCEISVNIRLFSSGRIIDRFVIYVRIRTGPVLVFVFRVPR